MGYAQVASVARAIEDSWRLLAGTPLHIAASELAAADLPHAQHFAIAVGTGDGERRMVVVQIANALLYTLASAMFDLPVEELDDEMCGDAGKELANILASCCIRHLAELENGEVGLPRLVSAEELHAIEHSGALAAHFIAESDAESLSLSLSIIEPRH